MPVEVLFAVTAAMFVCVLLAQRYRRESMKDWERMTNDVDDNHSDD